MNQKMKVKLNPYTELQLNNLLAQDPSLIRIIKSNCITPRMWKACIKAEPPLFQFIKNPSERMILFALSQDGANLKYLEKMGITITEKMIYTAISNYPAAIYFVPKEMQTNTIKEYACTKDPSLMMNVPLRKEFIDRKLKEDSSLVRFIPNATEDQWCKAIEDDVDMCLYVKDLTPKIKQLIINKYPETAHLMRNRIYGYDTNEIWMNKETEGSDDKG